MAGIVEGQVVPGAQWLLSQHCTDQGPHETLLPFCWSGLVLVSRVLASVLWVSKQ